MACRRCWQKYSNNFSTKWRTSHSACTGVCSKQETLVTLQQLSKRSAWLVALETCISVSPRQSNSICSPIFHLGWCILKFLENHALPSLIRLPSLVTLQTPCEFTHQSGPDCRALYHWQGLALPSETQESPGYGCSWLRGGRLKPRQHSQLKSSGS